MKGGGSRSSAPAPFFFVEKKERKKKLLSLKGSGAVSEAETEVVQEEERSSPAGLKDQLRRP